MAVANAPAAVGSNSAAYQGSVRRQGCAWASCIVGVGFCRLVWDASLQAVAALLVAGLLLFASLKPKTHRQASFQCWACVATSLMRLSMCFTWRWQPSLPPTLHNAFSQGWGLLGDLFIASAETASAVAVVPWWALTALQCLKLTVWTIGVNRAGVPRNVVLNLVWGGLHLLLPYLCARHLNPACALGRSKGRAKSKGQGAGEEQPLQEDLSHPSSQAEAGAAAALSQPCDLPGPSGSGQASSRGEGCSLVTATAGPCNGGLQSPPPAAAAAAAGDVDGCKGACKPGATGAAAVVACRSSSSSRACSQARAAPAAEGGGLADEHAEATLTKQRMQAVRAKLALGGRPYRSPCSGRRVALKLRGVEPGELGTKDLMTGVQSLLSSAGGRYVAVGASVRKGCVEIVLELRQLPQRLQSQCSPESKQACGASGSGLLSLEADQVMQAVMGCPLSPGTGAAAGTAATGATWPSSLTIQEEGRCRLFRWGGNQQGGSSSSAAGSEGSGGGGGGWVEEVAVAQGAAGEPGASATASWQQPRRIHIQGASPVAIRLPFAGSTTDQLGWLEADAQVEAEVGIEVVVQVVVALDLAASSSFGNTRGVGPLLVHGSQPEGSQPTAMARESSAAPALLMVARGSWGNCLPVRVDEVKAAPHAPGKPGVWLIQARVDMGYVGPGGPPAPGLLQLELWEQVAGGADDAAAGAAAGAAPMLLASWPLLLLPPLQQGETAGGDAVMEEVKACMQLLHESEESEEKEGEAGKGAGEGATPGAPAEEVGGPAVWLEDLGSWFQHVHEVQAWGGQAESRNSSSTSSSSSPASARQHPDWGRAACSSLRVRLEDSAVAATMQDIGEGLLEHAKAGGLHALARELTDGILQVASVNAAGMSKTAASSSHSSCAASSGAGGLRQEQGEGRQEQGEGQQAQGAAGSGGSMQAWWAAARMLILGFEQHGQEAAYGRWLAARITSISQLWSPIFIAIQAACAHQSYAQGTLAEDAPCLLIVALPYVVTFALACKGHAKQVEASLLVAQLLRAGACALSGLGFMAWPQGYMTAISKGLDFVNEPLVVTIAEQMRVRPLLLARSAICVGLALCHARQGLPYPYLRALVGNSICVLTGSLLDLYRRRLFMHATEAASASSATACTDGGVVAPGLAGAGRAVGPSSSKTVGKPHAE